MDLIVLLLIVVSVFTSVSKRSRQPARPPLAKPGQPGRPTLRPSGPDAPPPRPAPRPIPTPTSWTPLPQGPVLSEGQSSWNADPEDYQAFSQSQHAGSSEGFGLSAEGAPGPMGEIVSVHAGEAPAQPKPAALSGLRVSIDADNLVQGVVFSEILNRKGRGARR